MGANRSRRIQVTSTAAGIVVLVLCLGTAGCSASPNSQAADTLEHCVIGEWEAENQPSTDEIPPGFTWETAGFYRLKIGEDKIHYDVDYTHSATGVSDGKPWTYNASFKGTSEQEYTIEGTELVYGWDKTDGVFEVSRTEDNNPETVSRSAWGVPPYGLRAQVTCESDRLTIENLSWGSVDGGEGVTEYKRM